MEPDLVAVLRCPTCGRPLRLDDRTARCPREHAYDVAKQGYLNLLPAASTGIDGDSAAMVGARTVFLGSGHYAPIRDALILAADLEDDDVVAEVGAGTGYYLAGVLGLAPRRRGIALDVSKYAARRAAKIDRRIGSVVCDAWQELPLLDGTVDLLLNVFAPRNAREMARVLTGNGRLLVVTPNQNHLTELVEILGLVSVDADKERRLQDSLQEHFDRAGTEVVEETMRLDHTAVEQLVLMTPSARHLNYRDLLQRIAVLPDPMIVTLSVTLSTWMPARARHPQDEP